MRTGYEVPYLNYEARIVSSVLLLGDLGLKLAKRMRSYPSCDTILPLPNQLMFECIDFHHAVMLLSSWSLGKKMTLSTSHEIAPCSDGAIKEFLYRGR